MRNGITINPATPHEAILAANEAKGLSENDRKRIIAAAEQQVEQHRQRVLSDAERDADKWAAEADAAHDAIAEAEIAYDAAVKAAGDGRLSSAELSERLEQIQRNGQAAMNRLESAKAGRAAAAEKITDPYGTHLERLRRFPTLTKVRPDKRMEGRA